MVREKRKNQNRGAVALPKNLGGQMISVEVICVSFAHCQMRELAVAHHTQNSSVLQHHSDHVASAQVLQEFMGSLPGYGMQITKIKAFGVATTKRGDYAAERDRGVGGLKQWGTEPSPALRTPRPRRASR